jgi:cell division protein FtsL
MIDTWERELLFWLGRPMKRILGGFLFIIAVAILPVAAQAPPTADDQQLLALLKEVMSQQGQISDNNTKIEAKMAEVTETVRIARIFAGRTGK